MIFTFNNLKREQKWLAVPTILFRIQILSLFFISSCGQGTSAFSGKNAFQYLEEQCSFGPRNPGSEGYVSCRNYLIETLNGFADSVFTQSFQEIVDKDTFQLENIIASFYQESNRHILLGAHWDTRPWADRDPNPELRNKPIIGANDGASGVSVLLELSRMFHENPPPVNISIVLFDGEDLGQEGNPKSYARGSAFFAEHLPVSKPEFGIILDMVGDIDLSISIERNSYNQNPELVKVLWQEAESLQLPAFKHWLGYAVYDDHVPLWTNAKIPAVDIIDFEYPNRSTNFWHTHQDIPANCSPASLEQVGTLLTKFIYGLKTND